MNKWLAGILSIPLLLLGSYSGLYPNQGITCTLVNLNLSCGTTNVTAGSASTHGVATDEKPDRTFTKPNN